MSDTPLLGLSQRLPPSNIQAEQALLGALMANNMAVRHVDGLLEPEHFADPVHGHIYPAILEGHRAGRLVDVISLRAKFEHTGRLDEVGGTAYLAQLLTAHVGIIDAGEYARAIRDAWLRRHLIDIGEEVVNRAFGADPEMDGQQQVEAALLRLRGLLGRGPDHPPILGWGEPDTCGEMPVHAVALTENEIETLYTDHAYSAKVYRPRKRQKQSERDAHLHVWHTARAALFKSLLPKEEMEDDTPNPIYGEDGALVDMGSGPEVGP